MGTKTYKPSKSLVTTMDCNQDLATNGTIRLSLLSLLSQTTKEDDGRDRERMDAWWEERERCGFPEILKISRLRLIRYLAW